MALARLQARVHGYVQGVNFRWYTRRHASGLGLNGFVRNCEDGTVQVVAEGERELLEQLLAWLHHGPAMASVQEVEATWTSPVGEFSRFEVRY